MLRVHYYQSSTRRVLCLVPVALLPDLKVGEELMHRFILHPRREPLIQPQMSPPFHRHQVAKPLMSYLMRDAHSNPLLRLTGTVRRIDQQSAL